MSAMDQNTNITRGRVDNLVSPQAAVILKPMENISVYSAYSVSYLPASGDQFSSLTHGHADPPAAEIRQHRNRREMEHQSEAAVFDGGLQSRTAPTSRSPDRNEPAGSGLAFPNGATNVRGFETSLAGYVTDDWQSSLGYAYTDARIANDLTAKTVALPILPAIASSSCPTISSPGGTSISSTPMWGAALGVIYFGDSFAIVRRHRQTAGLRSLRHRALSEDQRDMERAAQRREYLQQGILGVSGRQQQHLAGPVADLQDHGESFVLRRKFPRRRCSVGAMQGRKRVIASCLFLGLSRRFPGRLGN